MTDGKWMDTSIDDRSIDGWNDRRKMEGCLMVEGNTKRANKSSQNLLKFQIQINSFNLTRLFNLRSNVMIGLLSFSNKLKTNLCSCSSVSNIYLKPSRS